MSRTPTERLRDILAAIDAIDRAEALAARRTDDPDLAETVLAATQFHVFTIGEAVKSLPVDLMSRYPEVPWSDIIRMCDLIGHHYYKIDAQIVRATVSPPLAALRAVCRTMIAEPDGPA